LLLEVGHRSFQWELRPTRSMSWQSAKRMMWSVTAGSMTIGAITMFLGFPLVLPFCGLEAVFFCVAFYLVQAGGKIREIIKIENNLLIFERGGGQSFYQFAANKKWVRVLLVKPNSKIEKLRLFLRYAGEEIELGCFLNDEEKRKFAKVLINAMH